MQTARWILRALGVVALCALLASTLGRLGPADAAAPFGTSFKPGLDLSLHDPTCKPCTDFYRFATGNFVKKYPAPAGYSYWNSFGVVDEDNQAVLRQILADAAKDTSAPPGSNEQKIGGYYASCMDDARVEAAGLTPIQPALDAINAVTDVPSLVKTLGALNPIGIDVGWTIDSTPDLRDSSKTTAEVDNAGLGMPDRDYYIENDDRTKAIRAAYVTYVTTMLTYGGLDAASAATAAQNILTLETVLAKATPTRAALRDPLLTYHLQTLADLQKLTPAIDWSAYLAGTGAPAFSVVNVSLPDYMTALNAQLGATPIATWKNYALFEALNAYGRALPKKFVDTRFAFYGTALEGLKEQLPRDKRCIGATDGALGEALGAVYVAKVFPPAAKARALALVNNLQRVLAADITTLPWMSPATKQRAENKLALYGKKIGYPDRFRDYSSMTIDGSAPYATNVQAATRFATARDLNKIGKPTDRSEWFDSPPTVNAYYSQENNEIVFPAGILRPPFFSNAADDAVNYGGIGVVIGHEMTHGFDDQGRQFDEHGNHVNWWTPADAKRFKARAQCIVDEYNKLPVEPGAYENGSLVQGEAIADLGGATIAYRAFEQTPEFKAGKRIDGYTPQQRFFLAFAQVWAGTRTPAEAIEQSKTDPHPDDKYRINGTLANMPAFREAFGCKAPDKMVHVPSCAIW
jgi:predicted metalloendopeptidase